MTDHDLFLENWNSQRPLHTNSFERGLHRGSREQALSSRFIETTARTARNCLVLDLDHEQADWRIRTLAYDDGLIPEPSYWTINQASGHAHVGYYLDSHVSTDKAIKYAEDLRRGLTRRAGADGHYINLIQRNPLHPQHIYVEGTTRLYTLKELAEFVPSQLTEPVDDDLEQEVTGRNDHLFNSTRIWAYRNRHRYTDRTSWFDAVEALAITSHIQLYPESKERLPLSEVKGIAHSVSGWTWKKLDVEQFRATQTWRSQQAAAKRTDEARERWFNTFLPMLAAGMTHREIGENLGLSKEQVKERVRHGKKSYGC